MRLTAGFLALTLASATIHDDWLGSDKPLHFSATAGIALAGYAGARLVFKAEAPLAAGLGALAALTAGVAKELLDLGRYGYSSPKDLAWDVLGTVTGTVLAVLVERWLFAPRPAAQPAN
ncbi:MAG: hypothetical protein K1X89_17870 [Myxococcaceae bacterium]|nr:hypothetical protein [Myxococcaceae bacterium]